jgi:ribosomal-protein-alanine N-acetyltransferase
LENLSVLDLTPHFVTFPVLQTERFILRAVSADDTQAMFDLMRIPEVNTYLGRPAMTTMEQAEKRVSMFTSRFDRGEGFAWAITRREEGLFIGTVVLYSLDTTHHRAVVGYTLHPDFWGQGAATEAMVAVIDFAFKTLGLHSLKADADPDNAASRRVAEKLGFVQEGHFREDYYFEHEGRWGDTVQFGLLASEWQGRA